MLRSRKVLRDRIRHLSIRDTRRSIYKARSSSSVYTSHGSVGSIYSFVELRQQLEADTTIVQRPR